MGTIQTADYTVIRQFNPKFLSSTLYELTACIDYDLRYEWKTNSHNNYL